MKLSLTSEGSTLSQAALTWSAEPLDHLWLRMQYLDAQGSALLEVVGGHDPFSECHRNLTLFVGNDDRFKTLFWYFSDTWSELTSKLRFHSLSIAAQVWWRFQLFYNMFPWLFVWLIDGKHDPLVVATMFFGMDSC